MPVNVDERIARLAELVAVATVGGGVAARETSLFAPDLLTGLPACLAFHERLSREVVRARVAGRPVSVVLLDLDRFAAVNAALGREAGDRLLAEVARRLAEITGDGDLLARTAGDEFGWILPGATGAEALRAAERVRAVLGGQPRGPAGRANVSAGVCDHRDGRGSSDMIRLAGRALYRAKARGRDAAALYDPEAV